jgi:hypothetical protein
MSPGRKARPAQKRVAVYLFRRHPLVTAGPEWGTIDAICRIEGAIPLGRSAREVCARLLDADGFLPPGVSPDDVES